MKYTIDDLNIIINNNNVVILYFYSDEFIELNQKMEYFKNIFNPNFVFITINYLENEDLITNLFIKSIPLFRIYKNSEFIEEIFGTYNNIENIINLHIS
jgi:hypothetical protein